MSTARHRAIAGKTRKGRIARLAGAFAVAGALTAGIVGIAGPANAATLPAPHGNLPGCVLPAGAQWKLSGELRVGTSFAPQITFWRASANGHNYVGVVGGYYDVAPNIAVSEGGGAVVNCTVN